MLGSDIRYEELASGMIVASDYMPHVRTVTLMLQVNTGSMHEKLIDQGVSHFLEHMAFKGTKTRDALRIAQEFDEIGGQFNAYTGRYKTVYYAKVVKEDIKIAAEILSDILQNSVFAHDEIERERDVILQEIAQTNDAPDDVIFDLFHEVAYPEQSFGRSILGTVEHIKAVSREQILRYVDDNYFAGNMTLACAGQIGHDEVQEIAKKHWSSIATQGSIYKEEVVYKGGDVAVERDLEQVHIVLGFEGVSYLDELYFDSQVLALIAGGGMSSRLFQEVREKRGLAYTVSAYSSNYHSSGMFNMYSATSPDKANECLDVMISEMQAMVENISDDEIRRAKSQVRAGLVMSLESVTGRAEKLAGNIAAYGRYISIDEVLQKVEAISKESLRKIAYKIFNTTSTPTLATIGKIGKIYRCSDIVKKL